MTNPAPTSATITLGASKRVIEYASVYGTGVTVNSTLTENYDVNMRLTKSVNNFRQGPGPGDPAGRTFVRTSTVNYDSNGLLKNIRTDQVEGDGGSSTSDQVFVYENKTVNVNLPTRTSLDESFKYDELGNLIQFTERRFNTPNSFDYSYSCFVKK
jgi:hypothetical protein